MAKGLPQKEDALVEVDEVVMFGEDGSATCDHGETELLTISSVTVTLYTAEGTTHSRLYNADEPLGPLFELHCTRETIVGGGIARPCRWATWMKPLAFSALSVCIRCAFNSHHDRGSPPSV